MFRCTAFCSLAASPRASWLPTCATSTSTVKTTIITNLLTACLGAPSLALERCREEPSLLWRAPPLLLPRYKRIRLSRSLRRCTVSCSRAVSRGASSPLACATSASTVKTTMITNLLTACLGASSLALERCREEPPLLWRAPPLLLPRYKRTRIPRAARRARRLCSPRPRPQLRLCEPKGG